LAGATARGSATRKQAEKAKKACATARGSATSVGVETAKIGWRNCPRQRNEQQSQITCL
jgi:hypothetical protein